RVVAGGMPLPFASRSLRGVALVGGSAGRLLGEGIRVVAPGGRLVAEGAPEGAAERAAAEGFRVLLDQEGTLVAERPGAAAHVPR
ncbi:MAG: hypothetical protein JO040_11095, partial [Gemmatimonadetes bacterium]|nr:hypothetical protein [Gemmatimonadota bacterium]